MLLSVPYLTFMEELRHQLEAHTGYVQQRTSITENPTHHPDFSIANNMILHRGRLWLPRDIPMISTLLKEYRVTPTGRHTGITKTVARISENFYWPGLRDDVTQFIATCLDCQFKKYETKKLAGLLYPLPVPHRLWEDLSLDFITGLPPYRGYSVILVVVDRFSKGIHLGMLPMAYTAYNVASLLSELVVKLHGVPRSLVSDRDPLFLSKFWQELFRLSGTQLKMSSAYHPQSDGQTEVLNCIVEQHLWSFVHHRPSHWGKFLAWAEYSHNTSWNSATGVTPYEVTYGRKPPSFPAYLVGTSNIDAVDTMITDKEEAFQFIQKKLLKAQASMKDQADVHRCDVSYQPGDWVLLKLRPYRQITTKGSQSFSGKLAKRFNGPFKVLARIDKVAYRLELPIEAKIHLIFHYSMLKLFHGNPDSKANELPGQFVNHQPVIIPMTILDYRRSNDAWEVLVQWQGLSPDDTSWEDWNQLQHDYHLGDKVTFQGPWSDREEGKTRTETKTHAEAIEVTKGATTSTAEVQK